MKTPFVPSLLAAAAVSALSGCAALKAPAPHVDATFGEATRQTMAMQTVNRDAGRGAALAQGFDAQSAVSAIGRHRDSFKTPPPSFTVIGIGGGSGGGGQ
jgi:hypothetical protein